MPNYFAPKDKKRIPWRSIFDVLFIVFTIGSALAMAMALLSQLVSPQTNWVFAFFGLAATPIFAVNIILLLVWTIRLRWWALIPLVVVVMGLGQIFELVQIRFITKYDHGILDNTKPSPKNELRVMTFNVHGFYQFRGAKRYMSTLDSVTQYIANERADVVCLQEYQLFSIEDRRTVDSIMQGYPYRRFNDIVDTEFHSWGLAVYSRLPIIDSCKINFAHQQNRSMYVDVLLGNDTLRVFNCHLQTTQINQVKNSNLPDMFTREDSEEIIRAVGSKLRNNFKVRAMQSDTVAQYIRASPYPTIVMGDFNSPPISYTYHQIRGSLCDAFVEEGTGYGYTYKPLHKIFRIDYILYTDDKLEALSYDSPHTSWSDHNPVIVRFKLNK